MNARISTVAAALCALASVAGCTKNEDGHAPAPPTPTITVTASASTVVANGTNTVDLDVTDTGGGPVTVTTPRGSFAGGATQATVQGASGRLTLTTCNAANAGCAGTFDVTATSSTGTATASLTFATLAGACASSCGADAGCAGLACTTATVGAGTCTSTSPSTCVAGPSCTRNPANATTDSSCTDRIDNDCDGKIDCAETECDGLACDTASPTSVCKAGTCTDLASGLAISVTPARARLPANGTTRTDVVVAVKSGGDAAPNMAVTLTTTLGAFTGGVQTIAGTTGGDGTVTFAFTAPATAGVARLTATVTAVPTVGGTAFVTIPRLGSIQVPAPFATRAVMGVQTSGWNELNGVAVQVLDDQELPYPDGLVVHFEHRRLGGSAFGAPTVDCAPASPACSGYDAAISGGPDQLDETGLATAPLVAGRLAGTLAVTATATAGGVTRTVALPGIAVVGAKASLANLSIVCSPRNVPALAEHDCAVSWVDAPITCAALLKDRFDNLLGTATQVIFASEASAVGQVTTTAAFDPAQPGDKQPDLGTATQIFQTLGAGLPFDVAPQPGEVSVSHAADGCGTRIHNPRDGVVTVAAIADGEEAFFDANGNGQYDAGEPFVDQGEPFVDQDDDGAFDPGEWFLDVDGSSSYTAANGQWDAQAKIWTQTAVVYSGDAARLAATATTFLGTRWIGGAFPGACVATPEPAPFTVLAKVAGPPEIPATSVSRVVVASDMNLNRLHEGTTYEAAVEAPGAVKVTYGGLPSYADDLGMFYRYWPCDGTGACASQCRATGAAAPCTMRPSLSAFDCGIAASVTITGGDEADGVNVVDWLVDTPWDVFLGAKVSHSVVVTTGQNL